MAIRSVVHHDDSPKPDKHSPGKLPLNFLLGCSEITLDNYFCSGAIRPFGPSPCGKQDTGGKPVKFKKCHGAVVP